MSIFDPQSNSFGKLLQPVGLRDPSSGYDNSPARSDHRHQLDENLDIATIVENAASRPTGSEGMLIYQVDKKRFYRYLSGGWKMWGGSVPRVSVFHSVSQTFPTNFSNPSFDSEDYDTDAFHPGSSSTLTIPSELDGVYTCSLYIPTDKYTTSGDGFVQVNGAGKRFIDCNLVGGTVLGSCDIPMTAGQTLVPTMYNGTGSAGNMTTNTNTYFQLIWRSPL